MKWIIPIILIAIISSSLIALNLEPEEDINADLDPNRPTYLITNEHLPSDWVIDLEMKIDDKFYVQINTPESKAFSIETLNFVSEDESIKFLNAQNTAVLNNGLDVVFPNQRVDLSLVDAGYVWEVKSPCCYSRGVTFSISSVYIHLFGSQDSTWDDILNLYNQQVSELYHYLGVELPNSLDANSTQEAAFSPGAVMSFVAVTLLALLPIRSRGETE